MISYWKYLKWAMMQQESYKTALEQKSDSTSEYKYLHITMTWKICIFSNTLSTES